MAPSYPASSGTAAAAAAAAAAASLVIRNGLDGLRRRIQGDLGSFRQWPVLFVSNPILPDHNQQGNQGPSSQGHHRSSRGGRPSASPSTNDTADVLRKQQHLHDKRQLSQVSHKTQFLLQQQLGLRLLGVEQAFPFSSDHQIEHVRKLASRFSIGSSNNGGGGVVVGVGSGSCIDLARAMAMSSKGSGNVGTRLVLVPATHVSVMVSGGAAAAASASSQRSKTSSPSSLVPCPPLVLDSDEATLLPFDKGRESSNLTVVQLDSTSMVGCPSTSTLAASSLVLDRILQLSRQRSIGNHFDSDEEPMRGLGELLDRLLLGAESSTDSNRSDDPSSSQSIGGDASGTKDETQLWDSLFDVGRKCLNFTSSSGSDDSNNMALPYRPVPMALAASLAAVVPQSVPELMACTVPYLLSQMDDSSQEGAAVTLETRSRIERLMRDVPPPLPLEPPLDEYLAMLQANQTMTHCRDDDQLLQQIVTDMVSK